MRRREQARRPRTPGGAGKKVASSGRGEGEPAAGDATFARHSGGQQTVRVSSIRAARWQPLPPDARDYIASAIDTAVLSLPPSGLEPEACLRQLKQRLLDRCSTIIAPVRKPKGLRNCRRLIALEEEQLREGQSALRTLQEELAGALDKLEQSREEAQRLQEDISQLPAALEDAQPECPQDVPCGDLKLPRLPAPSFQQAALQEQLERMATRADVLADLRTLGHCADARTLRRFLELVHATTEPAPHASR